MAAMLIKSALRASLPTGHCHSERQRRMVGRPAKRKAMLNFSFPLEGNAAKRQRVYEVKNDNVAPLLLYTGPTLVDSRILCRMRAVRTAYETFGSKYKSAGRMLYAYL